MKFSDLKNKGASEVQETLMQTKKELMNLRFRKASGDMPNTARFKQLRKTVARIKTLIKQNKKGDLNA